MLEIRTVKSTTRSALLAALATLLCGAARAQSPPAPAPTAPAAAPERKAPAIALELNKLEPASGSCRAYFVVENKMAELVRELRLDTFIFDGNGVIVRRIGLTFPDLRPERTKVVPFDLSGANCGEIGRMLVNDVLTCTGAAGAPIAGCNDAIAVSTRAGAKFEY